MILTAYFEGRFPSSRLSARVGESGMLHKLAGHGRQHARSSVACRVKLRIRWPGVGRPTSS
jgi:hypothetical protein